MNKLIVMMLMVFCWSLNAGELVKNAKISRMANISSNVDGLYLNLNGTGTGVCVGMPIFFKVENMPGQSKDAMNRAVTMASMAFSMDLYVQIHNYNDDDCNGASYIRISKTPF